MDAKRCPYLPARPDRSVSPDMMYVGPAQWFGARDLPGSPGGPRRAPRASGVGVMPGAGGGGSDGPSFTPALYRYTFLTRSRVRKRKTVGWRQCRQQQHSCTRAPRPHTSLSSHLPLLSHLCAPGPLARDASHQRSASRARGAPAPQSQPGRLSLRRTHRPADPCQPTPRSPLALPAAPAPSFAARRSSRGTHPPRHSSLLTRYPGDAPQALDGSARPRRLARPVRATVSVDS